MNNTSFEIGVQKITKAFVEILITPIIWLLTGAAMVLFFYGLAMFILNADSQDAKEKGKKHMISGFAGLFIIFAVWGIVSFVGDTVESFRTSPNKITFHDVN